MEWGIWEWCKTIHERMQVEKDQIRYLKNRDFVYQKKDIRTIYLLVHGAECLVHVIAGERGRNIGNGISDPGKQTGYELWKGIGSLDTGSMDVWMFLPFCVVLYPYIELKKSLGPPFVFVPAFCQDKNSGTIFPNMGKGDIAPFSIDLLPEYYPIYSGDWERRSLCPAGFNRTGDLPCSDDRNNDVSAPKSGEA